MTAPRLIFLIGYRGAGKTTVARVLAERLGWKWADADETLEQRLKRFIPSIFATEGEAWFREQEALVLQELCRLEKYVVATGGGVVLRPENRQRMKQVGRVLWLTADSQTLWRRLEADPATASRRPKLAVGGLQEISELLQAREPSYAACADCVVDTTNLSPSEVVAAIVAWLSVQSNPSPATGLPNLPTPADPRAS